MSIILTLDPLYQFTNAERLALEALILRGRTADSAFRHWLDCVDFENIKVAATQLLPALFARHAGRNSRLPHHPRMKGVFRLHHVRNSLSLDAAWRAAALLAQGGMPVMLFKGAALTLAYYERPALRPMGDVDIAVPAQDYARAGAMLQDNGWRYRYEDSERLAVEHSCDYVNATGQAIDLHARLLPEVRDPAFERDVFARARPFDWRGLRVLIPAPEDEALIAIVNAMRELGAVRLIWIADLARIMTKAADFDWSRLWKTADEYGLLDQVFHGLHIASHVHGLESLHDALVEQIATTPDFERAFLRDAIAVGATFGLCEENREAVNRVLGDATRDLWAEHDAKRGYGVIRAFETERGEIKALHLRWRHVPFLQRMFRIADNTTTWDDICRGQPSEGAGVLEILPGLLQRAPAALPPEAYQAGISILTALPETMQPGEQVTIRAQIANRSAYPWIVSSSLPNLIGLSWHVLDKHGATLAWDHPRCIVRPNFLTDKCLAFVEPDGIVDCALAFTAPAERGEYRIQFDLVHEMVRWFTLADDDAPLWNLTVS